MTRFEPGISRGDRAVRGDRTTATGYSHRGTGRSIDDVRGRGREALAATRGANALALSPAVEPVRRRQNRAPARDEPTYAREVETELSEPIRGRAAAPGRGAAAGRSPARGERSSGLPAGATATARVAGATTTARTSGATAPATARPGISVVPPLPVSAPRAPFVTLVLFVVVIGVLGILVINTKINENAFRLHDMKEQQGSLDQHEQRLQREIAEKESPGNLAAAARQLGLVRADSPVFLRLPDGRSLGVPKPASGPASVAGQNAASAGNANTAGRPGG
jgi:hypothetical protein